MALCRFCTTIGLYSTTRDSPLTMSFLALDPSSIQNCLNDSDKVSIVISYWHACPHLDTDFEIALSLLRNGGIVHFVDLSCGLPVNSCTHPQTHQRD